MVYVHSCWQKLGVVRYTNTKPMEEAFCGCMLLWVLFRGVFHLFFLFVPGSKGLSFQHLNQKEVRTKHFKKLKKKKGKKKKGIEQKGSPHFEHC